MVFFLRPTSHSFLFFFFFNDTATTEIYTLSLHDALPISPRGLLRVTSPVNMRFLGPIISEYLKKNPDVRVELDRKSTRLNSSHLVISYAVFCLKKKNLHLRIDVI